MRRTNQLNKAKKIFLLALFPLFGFTQTNIQQGSPFIKNYTSKEINGGPQIWCWAQDKRGMVYVGDLSGVVEFNGREWNRIGNINTIVRSIDVDSSGRVYVGSSDDFGYLQPNKKGEMKYVSLSQAIANKGIKFLDIWKVISTSQGVFFFSNKYLFRYFNKKVTAIPVDFKVQDAYLLNKKLYIPTQKGLCYFDDNKQIRVSDKVCFHMTPWRGDECICVNRDLKLSTYNLKTSETKEFKTQIPRFFTDNPISDIARIDNTKFAVATKTGKIVILSYNGDLIRLINKEVGLPTGWIYSIFVDDDKNIWVCSSKGVSKIDISFPISKFDEKNNINSNVIKSCLFDGKRYIATIDGIYYLPALDLKNLEESQKFIKVKPINDESWDFMVLNQQLYAVCSKGVWVINDKTAKLIYSIKAPQKAHCFNTSSLFPDVIFVGMRGNLKALKLNGSKDINQIKVISEMDFPEITEKIRRITSDKDGNLWLNTQFNGVYFVRFINGDLSNHRVTLLGNRNGLSNLNSTECYKVDNQITLSTGSGLLQPKFPTGRNKSDSLIRFDYSLLFGDTIKDLNPIVEAVTKKKYLLAGNGLWLANIYGRKKDFDTCGFNRLNFTIESYSIGADSLISFCTPDGLFYYNLTSQRNFKKTFHAIITKVEAGTDSVLFYGTYYSRIGLNRLTSLNQNPELVPRLTYNFNSITFHYSGLFFEDPELTEYQHQLVGFDKDWSDWTTENKANYTHLYEGKYTLKVRAKNVYGVVSDIAEYSFVILPPWYRTWWAILLYLILMDSVIYAFVMLYRRRLKAQKEFLEIIIKERTNEISEKAQELKTTNEKLVEMDKYKQGITSMIVHNLKNPLNAIINAPENDPANQLKHIKQTGRQMLNIVMNILDVNKYEETKLNLNIEEFALIDSVNNAIENILFLSNEKNIRIINQIQANIAVKADLGMIERVFVNLLTNAIKYTPTNGTISLKAEMNESKKGSFIKVSIADTGIGIPVDKIPLVFEKFGQIVAKNSGSVRSTGLGLTCCKMVVEAHGGEINVESEIEKGSTFWFTIPGFVDTGTKINEPGYEKIAPMETKKLSQANQRIIEKYLFQLQNTEIYKITDLNIIIEKIDASNNDEIMEWKRKLQAAIDSGNEDLYKKLISITPEIQ